MNFKSRKVFADSVPDSRANLQSDHRSKLQQRKNQDASELNEDRGFVQDVVLLQKVGHTVNVMDDSNAVFG